MPQITLQYTTNIDQSINIKDLFIKIHRILANVGGIKIENCKSRAIKIEDYYIGQGESSNAFVHVNVAFLEGRPLELKKDIGGQLLGLLKKYYTSSIAEFNLQITVEIRDIMKELYFKHPEKSIKINRQGAIK